MKSSQKTALKPDFRLNGKPYTPKEGDEIVFTTIYRVKFLDCCTEAHFLLKNSPSVHLHVDGQEIHSHWLTQKLKEGWHASVTHAIHEAYGLTASISCFSTWKTWISKPPNPAAMHNLRYHCKSTYRLKKPE